MTKWSITSDVIHNWVNYQCLQLQTDHSPLTALVSNLPDNIKMAIRRACDRHHQDGTSAKAEAEFLVSEFPDNLYIG